MLPLGLIIGGVLTAASVAANTMAQNRIQSARAAAMRAERNRQRRLDQEAMDLVEQDREAFGDFEQKQTEETSELAEYFTDASGAVNDPNILPAARGDIIVQSKAKADQRAKGFNDQQSQALGALRAFGDVLGGLNRDQGRNAMTVGQLARFKEGSAGVLPYELMAANEAGQLPALLGDLLGFGGSIAIGQGLRADQGLFGGDLAALFGGSPAPPGLAGLKITPTKFSGL